MLDFLWTGEFWMDALIIAGISAVAVIVGAIINAAATTKKLDKTVAVHDTKADKNKELLTQGQCALSQEHHGLKEQVAQVSGAVVFLKDEQLRESTERRALQGQPLDIQKTMNHITAQQTLLVETLRENTQLRVQLQTEREARLTVERKNAKLHLRLQNQEYERE